MWTFGWRGFAPLLLLLGIKLEIALGVRVLQRDLRLLSADVVESPLHPSIESDLEWLEELEGEDGSEIINFLPPPYAALALSLIRRGHEMKLPVTAGEHEDATVPENDTEETASRPRRSIRKFLKHAFVSGLLFASGLTTSGALNDGAFRGGEQSLVNSQATNISHFPGHAANISYFRGQLESAANSTFLASPSLSHEIDNLPQFSSCGQDLSCMVGKWGTAVDNMPEPSPRALAKDFAQTVRSVISKAYKAGQDMPSDNAAAIGLESAEIILNTYGLKQLFRPPITVQTNERSDLSDSTDDASALLVPKAVLGGPRCSGAGCFTDQESPPPHYTKTSERHPATLVDKWSSQATTFAPGSWKRATAWRSDWKSLARQRAPLLSGARASDVRQGGFGDCWFLAGLASAAENNLDAIDSIFVTKNYNIEGYYELRLFQNGKWVHVVVDDYLPPRPGNPARANMNEGKLWVALLEKAYAKVFHGYGNIEGGFGNVAIRNVSGYPVEYIPTSHEAFNASLEMGTEQVSVRETWEQYALEHGLPSFLERSFAEKVILPAVTEMRASKLSMSDVVRRLKSGGVATANGYIYRSVTAMKKEGKIGEVPKEATSLHAFSILDAKEAGEHVFLKIRNPWGSAGPEVLAKYDSKESWGHNSAVWRSAEGSRIRKALGGKLVDTRDGVFWLEWNDFRKIFRGISIAHDSLLADQKHLGVQKHLNAGEVSLKNEAWLSRISEPWVGEAKDYDPNCREAALRGECGRNIGTMFRLCQLSCLTVKKDLAKRRFYAMEPMHLTVDSSQAGQTLTVALGNRREETAPIRAKHTAHLEAAVEFEENGVWKKVTSADLGDEVFHNKNDLYLRIENLRTGNYRVVAKAGWEGMKPTDTVFAQLFYTSGTDAEQIQKLRSLLHSEAMCDAVAADTFH